MPLSSFLLGRTRPLCRFQPISLSQPISPKLNYRRLHVIQTAPHTHKLPPLLIPNHVNGKNSHDKKFHWITSIVGATVVVGFAVTREENKASCQSEEPNPTVELVIRDVSRDSVNIWRELLIPDWPLILFSVLAAFASSVIGLLLPTIFGEIVDKAKEGTVVSALKIPALKAIGVLLLQGIVQFGYGSLINLAAERMVNRLKNILFSHILSQDIRFFDKYQTGDLSSILTSDIEVIRVAFKHSISMGVRSAVSFVGGAASLFMISKELSLLMLLVVPGVVAVGTVYVRFLKTLSRQVQKSIAHTNAVAAEVISNIRTVRAFTNENLERKRYAEKSGESLSLAQKMGVQIATLQGLSTVALNGIGLIVYWYGGYQVSLGHMTAGSLTSFMMHTLALQNSLQQLSILTSQALSASGAIARFEEMARITPKIGAGAGTHLLKLPNVKGVIELRNVTFSYPSRENQQVLTNFTLSLPAGKVTALAGPSGGGKTTVTSLVERFYDPQAGEVTLDEVPLQVLDPTWLRSLIGVVNQEPVLFATTIKENIAYGKPGASDEEVIAAAQRANAHGFVTSFPDGYNTMVGERGIQLSGGQKQRIAIARAVLKNPLILILDEATSALDAESEAQVQQALQDLMKGRTVLVIAHRLSTVQNADNIAVVCDGQIVETGTHTELMRKAGVYAQLVARQMH